MDFYLCGEDEGAELLKTSAGKKLATNSQIRSINLYNIGIMGATGEIENLPRPTTGMTIGRNLPLTGLRICRQ